MVTSEVGLHICAFALGISLGSSRIYGFMPFVNKNQWRVTSHMLQKILVYNDEKNWNHRPFSELMSHITRMSLMHRNADQSYSMYTLVQWWALKHLPVTHCKGWMLEAENLIWTIYQSSSCWKDEACQRILVPHLIRVANEDALQTDGSYWLLKRLLNMVYRSLKVIQERDIAMLLNIRHKYIEETG